MKEREEERSSDFEFPSIFRVDQLESDDASELELDDASELESDDASELELDDASELELDDASELESNRGSFPVETASALRITASSLVLPSVIVLPSVEMPEGISGISDARVRTNLAVASISGGSDDVVEEVRELTVEDLFAVFGCTSQLSPVPSVVIVDKVFGEEHISAASLCSSATSSRRGSATSSRRGSATSSRRGSVWSFSSDTTTDLEPASIHWEDKSQPPASLFNRDAPAFVSRKERAGDNLKTRNDMTKREQQTSFRSGEKGPLPAPVAVFPPLPPQFHKKGVVPGVVPRTRLFELEPVGEVEKKARNIPYFLYCNFLGQFSW